MQGADKEVVDAAARGDVENSCFSQAERELLNLVKIVTLSSSKVTPDTIEKVREAGWDDREIGEAVLVAGMFAMFNRVADSFGLQDPNYFEKEEQGIRTVPATRHGSENR